MYIAYKYSIRVWHTSIAYEYGIRVWHTSMAYEYGIRVWHTSIAYIDNAKCLLIKHSLVADDMDKLEY